VLKQAAHRYVAADPMPCLLATATCESAAGCVQDSQHACCPSFASS
jgi:hypothetical protein